MSENKHPEKDQRLNTSLPNATGVDTADSDRKTQPIGEKPRQRRNFFAQFFEEREATENIVFEPLIQNPYDLSYTCLLIPRFPTHYLVGDVVFGLNEKMTQICIAYAWRLDFISVKSDYLQWVIAVPPSTAVGRFMSYIRRQTSEYIFEDFPRFKRMNPSGDFWATGYLIKSGAQPHPQGDIRQFIHETRQQQGLY